MNATTINKVCLSGLQTIHMADLMIRRGELNADAIRRAGLPEWPVTRAETISETDDLEHWDQ